MNNNLKKALYVLLCDKFNSEDLEIDDSDEIYINYIVNVLIDKNKRVCPFKNYNCIERCKINNTKCGKGFISDCNRELKDIWKEFIGVEINNL